MLFFKLATETAGAILSDALMTIVIGFVVVFAVLLLLTLVFKLFGLVMNGFSGEEEEENSAPVQAVPAAAPAAAPVVAPVNLGPMMSTAQVRNGIKPEETAAIAAAVACCLPADKQYTITKIDRAE